MATEDRWHDFAKEKPSEDMEGRNFIVSNGYSDTLSMWCGGYWENEPFMGNKLCDEVVRWKGYLTPEEEKANSQCDIDEVDCTAAELKQKLDEKDKDIAYWRKEYDQETKLTDALKAEIESLKASHYAEMVDAGMRERRLRRALWIARAMRAEAQWNRLLRDAGICFAVGRCKEWDKFNTMQKKWQRVERKCRAKAEQYK